MGRVVWGKQKFFPGGPAIYVLLPCNSIKTKRKFGSQWTKVVYLPAVRIWSDISSTWNLVSWKHCKVGSLVRASCLSWPFVFFFSAIIWDERLVSRFLNFNWWLQSSKIRKTRHQRQKRFFHLKYLRRECEKKYRAAYSLSCQNWSYTIWCHDVITWFRLTKARESFKWLDPCGFCVAKILWRAQRTLTKHEGGKELFHT